MKPSKTITDPENFQLLADETRRKIVFLLRAKEMTACQVAEELDLTPQAVYHHVRKLLSGGMIEVVREKRCGHLIESYYRATAETFHFTMGPTSIKSPRNRKLAKEQEMAVLEALKKIGFKLEYDEKQIAQLIDVKTKIDEGAQCCQKYEDAVADLEDLDFLGKLTTQEYAELLSMSDQEYFKQQEMKKKLRDLLISLTKK
jgi:DNA-binding transcriptional ArsR family regulator